MPPLRRRLHQGRPDRAACNAGADRRSAGVHVHECSRQLCRGDAPDADPGESVKLHVDGAPVARSYLRFNLQGLADPVVSAQLYVYASSGSSTGFQVNALSDNSWTEGGITYANAPAPGTLVANSGPFARNDWKAVDVTALVRGNGPINLALTAINATGLVFGSNRA